jgi:hypothetical protein
VPHARACTAAAAGRAGPGRTGVARFCHLIHIITGVSLFYGGGELIAPITVSSCLRLLSSSAGFLPPRRRHKSRSPPSVQDSPSLPREHISAALWFRVSYLCAHRAMGEQVPPEPSSACESGTGCVAIRFLGSDFVTARPLCRCLLPADCSRDSNASSSW